MVWCLYLEQIIKPFVIGGKHGDEKSSRPDYADFGICLASISRFGG